jgi:hypothetical protein
MPLKFFDETDPRVKARVNKLRNAALTAAKRRWKDLTYGAFDPSDGQYGWADLRFTHLRLTNVTYKGGWFNLATTSLGNDLTWINGKILNDDAFVLIYGIGNNAPSPQVTQIQFTIGAEENQWIDLSQLYGAQVAWCYFELGLVINPKTKLTVKYSTMVSIAVNTEYIYLIGDVLGLKSYIISYDNPDTV